MDFELRHGQPVMVDYTPSSGNVSAGEGVMLGNTTGITVGIAHRDIENTKLGALAVGGGVYEAQVASNYAAWTKVYKPSANAILTTTSTNNMLFGYTVEAASAANDYVKVLHKPYA